jgi:hypothetical protein
MKRIFTLLVILSVLSITTACKKEKKDDPRTKYVGSWNFKQTSFTFSGYYDYNVPPGTSPTWVSNTSTNVMYDDNSGSIGFGKEENELIIKYCSSCYERVINLDLNVTGSWTLNENDFIDYVQPGPAGYSSYYSTVTVEGTKL